MNQPTSKPRSYWFTQGIFVAFLLVAAMNAASYFLRSSTISPLFDGNVQANEAMGFPFEIWSTTSRHGPLYVDYSMMLLNVLVGLIIGVGFGFVSIAFSSKLERWVTEFEIQSKFRHNNPKLQFSTIGLMGATAIVGLFAGALTQWAGTKELLWFVYLLGPTTLIAIAFLPQGIRWQSRCVIVAITAIFVVALAIWSGNIRGIEFDRVMMGIYVFWTPQSAFAAILLLAGIMIRLAQRKVATAVS